MLISGNVGKIFNKDLEDKNAYILDDTLDWMVVPSYPFPVNNNLVHGFKGNYIFYTKVIYSEGYVVLNQEEWDELISILETGKASVANRLLSEKLSLNRNIPLNKNIFHYLDISTPYLDKSNKITSSPFVIINGSKKLFSENIVKAIFRIMYEEKWLWIENLLGIELSGNLALEFFKSNKEFLPTLEESIQLVQLARAYCAGSISKEEMDLINNQLITAD